MSDSYSRRRVLLTSAAGLTAGLAGCSDSGGGGEDGAGEDGDGGDGGPTVVTAGPDGELVFDPESVEVAVGETVRWEWDSPNHNVNPTSVPDESDWEGHPDVVDDPNEYEHTFEVAGTYEYECTPHAAAGMVGEVVVTEE